MIHSTSATTNSLEIFMPLPNLLKLDVKLLELGQSNGFYQPKTILANCRWTCWKGTTSLMQETPTFVTLNTN